MRWLLCGSSPTPVARRVVPAILVSLLLALFGTALLVLAPSIPGPGWLRATYVMFVVVILKLPLIAILWWLIARNHEWPGTKPTWLPPEQAEILAYLEKEADRAAGLQDAVERLEYLSQEAWHVADRLDGDAKVDALTVALRIDLVRERARRERSGH
ncbi:MAG: hypothetical protein ABGX38_04320 [Thermoleophilia bacterium]